MEDGDNRLKGFNIYSQGAARGYKWAYEIEKILPALKGWNNDIYGEAY